MPALRIGTAASVPSVVVVCLRELSEIFEIQSEA